MYCAKQFLEYNSNLILIFILCFFCFSFLGDFFFFGRYLDGIFVTIFNTSGHILLSLTNHSWSLQANNNGESSVMRILWSCRQWKLFLFFIYFYFI